MHDSPAALQAGSETWDVVIIGAGPAGSLAAVLLARAGQRVLLLERQKFPRAKVCGCCLNQRAQQLLQHADEYIAQGAVDLIVKLQMLPMLKTAAGEDDIQGFCEFGRAMPQTTDTELARLCNADPTILSHAMLDGLTIHVQLKLG